MYRGDPFERAARRNPGPSGPGQASYLSGCGKELAAHLEQVIDAIKKAHPYEETIIDIFPIYEIGMKRAKQ